MAERRPLIDGINAPPPSVDSHREKEFVYGSKTRGGDASVSSTTQNPAMARSPISTRIRSDFAAALKKASLERQLHGTEPHTLQDILEQAIEPWLKNNGYLNT